MLGVFVTLSQGPLDQLTLFGKSLFSLFDKMTGTIILPLGALVIAIFTGWFLGRKNVRDELLNGGAIRCRLFRVFMFIIRYLAPIAIAIIFLNGIGLIDLSAFSGNAEYEIIEETIQATEN